KHKSVVVQRLGYLAFTQETRVRFPRLGYLAFTQETRVRFPATEFFCVYVCISEYYFIMFYC
ncbi:hypothetical protein PHJA_000340700, partial [Phtheirospermum japonicum]